MSFVFLTQCRHRWLHYIHVEFSKYAHVHSGLWCSELCLLAFVISQSENFILVQEVSRLGETFGEFIDWCTRGPLKMYSSLKSAHSRCLESGGGFIKDQFVQILIKVVSEFLFILSFNKSFVGIVNFFVNHMLCELIILVVNKLWNKSRVNLCDISCRFFEKLSFSEVTFQETPGRSVKGPPQRS